MGAGELPVAAGGHGSGTERVRDGRGGNSSHTLPPTQPSRERGPAGEREPHAGQAGAGQQGPGLEAQRAKDGARHTTQAGSTHPWASEQQGPKHCAVSATSASTSTPYTRPVSTGETPPPRGEVPPQFLKARRGAGTQTSGSAQGQALNYKLLLLFSSLLGSSPAPASLSCWLGLWLRKAWKKGRVRAGQADAHSRWSTSTRDTKPGTLCT